MNKGYLAVLVSILLVISSHAQREPDRVYSTSIRSVKLHPTTDPLGYPIIALNSSDQLTLRFDDLSAGVKNYFYSLTLCNADWSPAQMNYFDYIKGYSQVRIATYRNSSISLTRYTHYEAVLPDRNCVPFRSGNYLLKVFLNGDTSRLAFTRRLMVIDQRLPAAVQILQPFDQQLFSTHQRLRITLDTKSMDVRYPQQQLKLIVLQNNRWDNALALSAPTFIRNSILEYNNEQQLTFPATKEFRWLNLRSFRLLGDRIRRQENSDSSFVLFAKEDLPRLPRQYFYYKDINGMCLYETVEQINPFWNADYAKVHLTLRPPEGKPYGNNEVVVMGELTQYGKDPAATMVYNAEKGTYETDLLLKQGYYDYMYALRNTNAGKEWFDTTPIEQNAWETENSYLLLVYYRQLGGRYDELIAVRTVSSQINRTLQ